MECKLLPLTPDTWAAYCALCTARGYQTPGLPPGAVLVGGLHPQRGPVLISGATHGPVDSRFIVIDHFVTNPTVSARDRRTAAVLTLRAVQTMATLMGRAAVVHPRAPKGLRRFAVRLGFQDDIQAVFAPPGLRVPWSLYRKEKAPKPPLAAEPELPVKGAAKMVRKAQKRKRR